jgi:hypothetical protein
LSNILSFSDAVTRCYPTGGASLGSIFGNR